MPNFSGFTAPLVAVHAHQANALLDVRERVLLDLVRGVRRALESVVEDEGRDALLIEELRDVVTLVVGPQFTVTATGQDHHARARPFLGTRLSG